MNFRLIVIFSTLLLSTTIAFADIGGRGGGGGGRGSGGAPRGGAERGGGRGESRGVVERRGFEDRGGEPRGAEFRGPEARGEPRGEERADDRGRNIERNDGQARNALNGRDGNVDGGASRTPSMSRVDQIKNAATKAPTERQLGEFLNQNRGQQGIKNGRQVMTTPNPNGRVYHPPAQAAVHAQLKTTNQVRNQIRQHHPDLHNWFNDSFFNHHHFFPNYPFHGAGWWGVAPFWGGINGWLGWGWDYPIYYSSDGVGETYVTYQTTNYHQNIEQPYPPAESATPSAQTADSPNPSPSPFPFEVGYGSGGHKPGETQDKEWLPLGIFAAGKTVQDASKSSFFLQLALNKNGDIAGTYYNSATDKAHPLEGSVDEETQEASWKVTDNPDSPQMTTGLYNLTQDVVNVQVKFDEGGNQAWTLVRLNK